MTRFNRPARRRVDKWLVQRGTGTIAAALFDLGVYPAAVPSQSARVRGEVFEMTDAAAVLNALDETEGYDPGSSSSSLYVRSVVDVTLDDRSFVAAWVYFYNAPLGAARAIDSGDYLQYLTAHRKIASP